MKVIFPMWDNKNAKGSKGLALGLEAKNVPTIYIYIYKRKEGPRSNRIEIENILIDDAVNLISEKHDPNAQMNHLQKEENKKTLQKAPVWCRPSTIRRSS